MVQSSVSGNAKPIGTENEVDTEPRQARYPEHQRPREKSVDNSSVFVVTDPPP